MWLVRLSSPEKAIPREITWGRIVLLREEEKPGEMCCVEQWVGSNRRGLGGEKSKFEGSLNTVGKKKTSQKQTDATPKKRGLGNDSEELALKSTTEHTRRGVWQSLYSSPHPFQQKELEVANGNSLGLKVSILNNVIMCSFFKKKKKLINPHSPPWFWILTKDFGRCCFEAVAVWMWP